MLADCLSAGRPIIDLTESNPTVVGLGASGDAIASAVCLPEAAVYDPSPLGMPVARRAVAEHLERRGLPVGDDRILLTAGTSEAYSFLFKMLANPGERVLVPRPSYPLFDYLAGLEAVLVEPYPLSYEGRWAIDFDALERTLEAGHGSARAVVVVNPNNPTGQALRRSEREILDHICAKRGVAIISDEVFLDYLFDEPSPGGSTREPGDPVVSTGSPWPGEEGPRALTFTLGGLSKSCGMPQMKLGWIVVGGEERLVHEAIERLEMIADTYLSVGAPVQCAAARLIRIGDEVRRAILSRVVENRVRLKRAVDAVPSCGVLEADGGWYGVLRVPSMRSEEALVLDLLKESDVLVHPGYFFDFPREAYLVLSLLPEPGRFAEGIRRILEHFSA